MSDAGNRFAHKFLLASFVLLMTAVSILAWIGYSVSMRLDVLINEVESNNTMWEEVQRSGDLGMGLANGKKLDRILELLAAEENE